MFCFSQMSTHKLSVRGKRLITFPYSFFFSMISCRLIKHKRTLNNFFFCKFRHIIFFFLIYFLCFFSQAWSYKKKNNPVTFLSQSPFLSPFSSTLLNQPFSFFSSSPYTSCSLNDKHKNNLRILSFVGFKILPNNWGTKKLNYNKCNLYETSNLRFSSTIPKQLKTHSFALSNANNDVGTEGAAITSDKIENGMSTKSASQSSYTPKLSESTTMPFQAEVSRVMNIIVNSLYTDKDVFLRELVSNAADACDKKKHILVKQNNYKNEGGIRIKADKQNSLLLIEDEGIGMTRNELIHNLGTIAQSGTANFLKKMAEGSDEASLIGQFGVGFYSAFLVADRVEVLSRRFFEGENEDNDLWLWQSSNGGTFTISKVPNDEYSSKIFSNGGTKVTLHVKEDCDEYLEDYKIKELLRKYSEFIQFPIQLWSEKVEYERVADPSPIAKVGEKPKMKTITKKRYEWERVNLQPPIWRRDKSTLQQNDYNEFYKTTFKAYDDPLGHIHFNVEGQVDFSALLFVPGSLPWELSKSMFDEQSRGIRLYVKRVFINDKFSEAIPRWLIFIRGVVDSEDLPLNVGREILQKSKMLTIINKRISEKAIEMIKAIKQEGGSNWERFKNNYSKYIKIGVVESKDEKEDVASLVEFYSTHSGAETTDLDKYISRMKTNQTAIYFVTGDSRKAASESPALEKLKQLGYEVLYCTEPVDEFCLSTLGMQKYKNYDVLDVTKQNIRLQDFADDNQKEEIKQKKLELEGLCDWLMTHFGKRVEKVVVSNRLTESPAILVQSDYGISPTMQRYIKQQSVNSGGSSQNNENEFMGMKMNQAILEINPDNSIIKQLHSLVNEDKMSQVAQELSEMILDVASLQGGYNIENPSKFGKRITALMTKFAEFKMDKTDNKEVTDGISNVNGNEEETEDNDKNNKPNHTNDTNNNACDQLSLNENLMNDINANKE